MSKDIEIYPQYIEDPDDTLEDILDNFEQEFVDDEMKDELEGRQNAAKLPREQGIDYRILKLDSLFRVNNKKLKVHAGKRT